MRSRRKNTRSFSGSASRGETGSWLLCWASQARYFLRRSSMIWLLRSASMRWDFVERALCPNRPSLYRLIVRRYEVHGILGQAPRGTPTEEEPAKSCDGSNLNTPSKPWLESLTYFLAGVIPQDGR